MAASIYMTCRRYYRRNNQDLILWNSQKRSKYLIKSYGKKWFHISLQNLVIYQHLRTRESICIEGVSHWILINLLNCFLKEHLWMTASVIGHVALLAPDQEDNTSRPELFYYKNFIKHFSNPHVCRSLFLIKLQAASRSSSLLFIIATLQEQKVATLLPVYFSWRMNKLPVLFFGLKVHDRLFPGRDRKPYSPKGVRLFHFDRKNTGPAMRKFCFIRPGEFSIH